LLPAKAVDGLIVMEWVEEERREEKGESTARVEA
jgi:hypothetical protein